MHSEAYVKRLRELNRWPKWQLTQTCVLWNIYGAGRGPNGLRGWTKEELANAILQAEFPSGGPPWLRAWWSGRAVVGGVQCDGCERFTICRRVGLADEEWLCRPCVTGEGWEFYEWDAIDDEFASSDASLGAASTTLNPPPGEHTGDQQ